MKIASAHSTLALLLTCAAQASLAAPVTVICEDLEGRSGYKPQSVTFDDDARSRVVWDGIAFTTSGPKFVIAEYTDTRIEFAEMELETRAPPYQANKYTLDRTTGVFEKFVLSYINAGSDKKPNWVPHFFSFGRYSCAKAAARKF